MNFGTGSGYSVPATDHYAIAITAQQGAGLRQILLAQLNVPSQESGTYLQYKPS